MIRTLLAALALLTAPLAAQVCTQPLVQTGAGYVVRVDGDSVAAYAAQLDAANAALVRKTATPAKRVTVTAPPTWEIVCLPAPIPPPPPPPNPPPSPPVAGVLFRDTFANGVRAGAQNGISYGNTSVDVYGSKIMVVPDAGSTSGYALGFSYIGKAGTAATDDAKLEQYIKLPKMTEAFLCFVWVTPSDYFHRDPDGPANNKMLRLWDLNYQGSTVHVGFSLLPTGNGSSKTIVEYMTAQGTGNFGTGPWDAATFLPNAVTRIGYYVKVASGVNVPDGQIKLWWNGLLVYNKTNLPITTANSTGGNYLQNGYFPGWSNSGFSHTTLLKLRMWFVTRQPTTC